MFTLLARNLPKDRKDQLSILKGAGVKKWKIDSTGFGRFIQQANLKMILNSEDIIFRTETVNGYYRIII